MKKILAILPIVVLLLVSCAQPPTPAPAVVPSIQDFTVYPEDKVAIERAEADIELNRKGDVLLTITDSRGKPAPGLSVKYQLVKHSFLFGVAVYCDKPRHMLDYNEKVFDLLEDAGIDYLTLHLSWRAVEPQEGFYTFSQLDQRFQPVYSKDFRLRGHALVFHGDKPTPEYVRTLSLDEYKAAVYRHVFDTVSHFKERIKLWDAINEPMNDEWSNVMDFSEAQKTEVIQVAIQAIRDAQPNAKIFINNALPASERPYTFLSKLNKAGIAYDIVGLQIYYNGYDRYSTTFERLTLAQIGEVIDHYSTLGKEIHITEFSVPSAHLEGKEGYWGEDWGEDLQAAYLEAAYTIFFSKPKVRSITWWNAYDHALTFIYQGGLCSESLQSKKAYYALKHLIKSWTTNGVGMTDEKGQVSFRGFGGTYEVVVSDPETGLSKKQEVTVEEQKDNLITIVLD